MSLLIDKERLPRWMKVPMPQGEKYSKVKNLIQDKQLHTICSSGNCPNKGECWSAGTATFMIMGEKCTRNCRFCYVKAIQPDPLDWNEPLKLAESITVLELKHCVITSVARDDQADGGAAFWAQTIRTVKERNPSVTMEVLIPDFGGRKELLDIIINEKPEVISHNVETVERISPKVRSIATYKTSLEVLHHLANSGVITKSGIMLGLGETEAEVIQTMKDIRHSGAKVLTIGQYLPPSAMHTQLVEYIKPEVFKHLETIGLEMGFDYVESGPLVRSSYHAERHVKPKNK